MAPVNSGVGSHHTHSRITTMCPGSHVYSTPVVLPRVTAGVPLGHTHGQVANEHINCDFFVVVDHLAAPIDRCLHIGVPGCHAVNEELASDLGRQEEAWDGGRGDHCLVELVDGCVLVSE